MSAVPNVFAAPSNTAAASADKLRDELIECDKLRAGFLKWKLLLIAVLGGTGLSGKVTDAALGPEARTFVLLLIPFVCVYADLLCLQNSLRVLSIRRFICGLGDGSSEDAPSIRYERRLGDGINSIYAMEAFALYWSTLLVDMLVGVGGILLPKAHAWTKPVVVFQVAAAAGVVLAVVIGFVYKGQLEFVSNLFPVKSDDSLGEKRVVRRLAFGTLLALAAIIVVPYLVL